MILTMDRGTTLSKPRKRVSFKKDHLVIVHPQYEDPKPSIFELRSSKPANIPSGVNDYNHGPSATPSKILHGDKRDIGERPNCLQASPLKSILKKTYRMERFQKVADHLRLEYVDNRSSLGLRGSTAVNSRKTLNTTAPQDKNVFSTSSPFKPGQRTEGQEHATLGCTTTTGRSTMSNYSVQSSRSPAAKQGNITIIRPLSGVTYDFIAPLNHRTRAEPNYRSAINAASFGSERELNVVGIPMSISDLYPALEKLQNSVERMADRTEKLYKDTLKHSSVTTAGAERKWKRTALRDNVNREKINPTILQRSYSSVNSSVEGSWNTKRMGIVKRPWSLGIVNARRGTADYSSDDNRSGRAALAWQPAPSSYRLPQPNESRFNSSAGRTSFAGLHKSLGRKF